MAKANIPYYKSKNKELTLRVTTKDKTYNYVNDNPFPNLCFEH